MTRDRLAEPFSGFDSVDERMKRVPLDLNDLDVRRKYIRNHIEWFLIFHPEAVDEFLKDVESVYGSETILRRTTVTAPTLFDLATSPQ